MPPQTPAKPSFSPYRRWRTGVHVGFLILVVLSVVVMANYLSRDYFLRFHLSSQSGAPLSPRTVKFLQSLTNHVKHQIDVLCTDQDMRLLLSKAEKTYVNIRRTEEEEQH